MESRVNYVLVGAFVLLLGAAAAGFLFWLGKYGSHSEEGKRYRAYFSESVSGLNVESPVKYFGMPVGSVQAIRVKKDDTTQIEVEIEVERSTPIRQDSYAILGSQGLTGLGYVEIKGGTPNSPLLEPSSEHPHPILETRPSMLSSLQDSVSDIPQKVNRALDKIDSLLSERNLNNFEAILQNLRRTTETLNQQKEHFTALLQQAATVLDSVHVTSQEATSAVRELKTKIADVLQEIDNTSQQANSTLQRFDSTIERGDYNLRAIMQENNEKLGEVLEQAKQLLRNADEMVENMKNNPSDLLFGNTHTKTGPGE